MEDVKIEEIKTEVYETEDVKIEIEKIDEENIKTENRLTFGIVVNDGILDFHDENVNPEETTTEVENYVEDNAQENWEVHSSNEQNSKIIEEIKTNCTRKLKDRCLLSLVKEKKELFDNPVSEVNFLSFGQICQEKVNPARVGIVNKSLKNKTKNESSVYCQSGHEEHGNEYSRSWKSDLASHIQSVHLKKKPFKCAECEFSFSFKSFLVRHVQSVHLKEKPFRCTECEYSCGHKSHLARHVRSLHLKEKPFRCTECIHSCSRKSDLEIHIRSVHLKQKPFACTKCEYSSANKGCLAIHIRSVHLKEKPFKCTECESLFSQKSNLSTHIRLVHKTGAPGADNVACKIATNNVSQIK